MRAVRPVLFYVLLVVLVLQGRSFELQDTIHSLIEENIHLHDQLENLTQALRDLKRMLWHHSNDHDEHHEHHVEDVQHLWDEWSEHGVYHCSALKHSHEFRKVHSDCIEASVQKLISCWNMPFVDMTCTAQRMPYVKK